MGTKSLPFWRVFPPLGNREIGVDCQYGGEFLYMRKLHFGVDCHFGGRERPKATAPLRSCIVGLYFVGVEIKTGGFRPLIDQLVRLASL